MGLWGDDDGNGPGAGRPVRPNRPTPFRGRQAAVTPPERPAEKLVATYQYRNAAGEVVGIKGRFEQADGKKRFAWKPPTVDGWPAGDSGIYVDQMPLWGADLVTEAPPDTPIWFVEGEKAAQACRDRGLLAVCFGGGASSIAFGESLHILAGRHVLLWPDNDGIGRRYMARIEAQLRLLAKSVRLVQVPYVEEHDDAVEYFERGGTVEMLLEQAPIDTPALEWIDDDEIRIRLPNPVGMISFHFSDIEVGVRSLETELSVSIDIAGGLALPHDQRINLLSNSAVDGLRRWLDDTFEQEKKFWVRPLNMAIALLRRALANHDPSVSLDQIEDPGDAPYLIDGIVPEATPILLYGKGSAAKGWLAIRMGLGMTVTGEFLGRECIRGGVLYVDYEDNRAAFKRRARRLLAGMGIDEPEGLGDRFHYWDPMGVPLAQLVSGLSAKIQRDGIQLIIVDSVVAACGGRPEEAETAQRYFNALRKLGIASLSIAHISKAGNGDDPFGSIFFTNFPRRTLLVTRAGEGDSFGLAVQVKKINDGAAGVNFGAQVTFHDRKKGDPIGTRDDVEMVPADVKGKQFASAMSLADQIEEALADAFGGELSYKDIAEIIDRPAASVRRTLYENKHRFVNLTPGKGRNAVTMWGLLGREERYG